MDPRIQACGLPPERAYVRQSYEQTPSPGGHKPFPAKDVCLSRGIHELSAQTAWQFQAGQVVISREILGNLLNRSPEIFVPRFAAFRPRSGQGERPAEEGKSARKPGILFCTDRFEKLVSMTLTILFLR